MTIKEKVEELNQMMLSGKVVEAFDKFYHADVVRQENNDLPRIGKEFNAEYEKKAIANVAKWHKVEVLDVAVNEETQVSMSVQYIEVSTKDGRSFQREEVAVQHWQEGLIIKEKFYYQLKEIK